MRLLEIALKKRSFTAPIYFLQAFSQLSPIVRDKGATICAAFVGRRSGRIYLRSIENLQTCCTKFTPGRSGAKRTCAGLPPLRCPAWSNCSRHHPRISRPATVATANAADDAGLAGASARRVRARHARGILPQDHAGKCGHSAVAQAAVVASQRCWSS